jgi:restriction system protein
VVAKRKDSHHEAVAKWGTSQAAYKRKQAERNQEVDRQRERYLATEPEAVSDYCRMVLENSSYPDCISKVFELEYNPVNRIIVVEYDLPAPGEVSDVAEVRYVASADTFVEKSMPRKEFDALYDSVLYQIALRTIHELFEADAANAVDAVVFNGWVLSTNPATGLEGRSCVLSVQAGRAEFETLGLKSVEPRACFKKLKGVAAAGLHTLTAVAPLLEMSREDRRFVASRPVADSITEGDNLAAMDWEDFEHLIRELFEQEFSSAGAEVKVTQASRDGGVDAVIFDPDPLHGGKTVVQAKRYTNTVGVSAVRDLYGTMMNEGANKGILVTTSEYGPDAYEFAKGKPMVLLSGGNLLHLLEKHGHSARIDLQEAKRLLGEMTPS